jgi:hypothetical protein
MKAPNHKPEEGTMPASLVTASEAEQPLLGVWKLESMYQELRTGERKNTFGEKPNGYLIFTPEKRMMALLTGEGRKPPNTDEDRIAAFWSVAAYSGTYHVEGDKWTTRVDVAWTETWVGSDQIRFFKREGDTLTVLSTWQPGQNLPGNPEIRGVLVWSRVKGPQ